MKEVFCFKPRHYEYNYEEWLIKKIKKLGYKANWDMGCKLMSIFSNDPRDVVDKLREARQPSHYKRRDKVKQYTKAYINKWIGDQLKAEEIKTKGYRVEWNVYTDEDCMNFELECVDRKDVVDFIYKFQNCLKEKCEIRPHITSLYDGDVAFHTPMDNFVWINN